MADISCHVQLSMSRPLRFLKMPPHCLKWKATPAHAEPFVTEAAHEAPRMLTRAVYLVISPLADAADGEAVPGGHGMCREAVGVNGIAL
jgi:hypothetical protein